MKSSRNFRAHAVRSGACIALLLSITACGPDDNPSSLTKCADYVNLSVDNQRRAVESAHGTIANLAEVATYCKANPDRNVGQAILAQLVDRTGQ